jgi:hypothetical protein
MLNPQSGVVGHVFGKPSATWIPLRGPRQVAVRVFLCVFRRIAILNIASIGRFAEQVFRSHIIHRE